MTDSKLAHPLSSVSPFFTAHPWHGVSIGKQAPYTVVAYIEIVPSDTIKYETDKQSGFLKIDRPQKYSNYCPALYGFLPQTYCGKKVGDHCSKMMKRDGIVGDNDPLDICILSEKPILRSNILVDAIPIGGFRTLDGNQADDKIIAVLKGDLVYGEITDVSQCPPNLIDRLRHYFLTYKDFPGDCQTRELEIKETFGKEEAHTIVRLAQEDYINNFKSHFEIFNHANS
ncbi:MAG: inorganic pyrophosphatase [Parachlamydiales bacterium]|nr:inorganic pyrophosphatase [Parachlamydiales bacterium]